MSLIPNTISIARADLELLSSASSLSSLDFPGSDAALASGLAGLALAPSTPAQGGGGGGGGGSSSSSSSGSSSSSSSSSSSNSSSGSSDGGGGGGSGAVGGNFVSEREVRRLEEAVREYAEVNDRIMAQNIALLADLEAAQRTVRDLRAGKDALAVQLKRALARG